MKKRIALLSLCFVCGLTYAQESFTDSVRLVKENYINVFIGNDPAKKALVDRLAEVPKEKEASDQNVIELQQLYPISREEVNRLVESIRDDGSWGDIDYADTKRSGWSPKIHTERILTMTKYYWRERKSLDADDMSRLTGAIHRAMNFWFSSKLVCKNWWYNQIGIPRTLGPAFLLFEQEMTGEEKREAVEVMKHSSFGMTGQNKIWLAGNVLLRALLENDWKLVREARTVIGSEITVGAGEGIQADWSFHQHGPQQQFGNYGLSFISNMGFYSEVFAGTSLAFTGSQQKTLVSLLLDGYRWIVWKGYWDVNALNRQLFRNADRDKGFILLFTACSLMKGSTPEVEAEIEDMIRQSGLDSDVANTFVGNKHFWKSDYTVHRTPRWMASVRMASERVIGTELVNEDNLKGYYMADGALYTYVRGDEYHNIFPFWNWRRIPGITTYESEAPIPDPNRTDSRNHSSRVGGVSNGTTGITAMQLRRNGLNANKAWIFADDYILCMGSDIRSDSSASVITSVDQRFRRGEVRSCGNGRFFHDNTGYIILQADSCAVLTEQKRGQWHDFMGMYRPEMLEEESVFSICLTHDKKRPSGYIYLILPASSVKEVGDFDAESIRIVRNDKDVQSVVIGGLCYLAAYQKTEVKTDSGDVLDIPYPGTYIIDMQKGEIRQKAYFEM